MLLRWLLPIVAMFALLGNAVAAFAAAGTFGDSKCCCPDPTKCKCHDHQHPKPSSELRRCAGDAEKVVPLLQAAVMPLVLEEVVVMAEQELVHVMLAVEDQFALEPEKPPF